MALTKYATAEILESKGSKERIKTARLERMADYEDYRTDDGYLYTRVRAISSRVNKNHDGWPAEELAKAYLTFIGKPIFVDHHNSDPSRARGVIVDAKLHVEDDFEKAAALDPYYASAPENHKPPTWIELLLEVDAKSYPKLAKAIIRDEIDGVSMGANVERSKCSHCDNIATTPEEYCTHVMQKGAVFDKFDEFGNKTASAAYEDCYDIGFFEISYVFDPADETALDLGGKKHAIAKTAGIITVDDWIAKLSARADGTFDGDPTTCSTCGGSGQAGSGPCSTCHGRGVETWPKEDGRTQPKTAMPKKKRFSPQDQARQEERLKAKELARKQREIADRALVYDRNRATEVDPYIPGPQGYVPKDKLPAEAPEWAPEGGSMGDPRAPLDGSWDSQEKYWKHPSKTPSDIKGPGELNIVNPREPAPINAEPVKPSFFRDRAVQDAASVPEDTRADRMKQKKRTQGGFMGGYGDPSQPGSGSPAPSPQLPDSQNCPTCGSAMQDGVCPQCTAQAQQPAQGGDAGMQPMAGYMDMEFDDSDATPPEDVQSLTYGMPDGMTPEDKANRAIGMSMTLGEAIQTLMSWGMGEEMATVYAEDAAARQRRNESEEWETNTIDPRMPADPFLSNFKITKDGHVAYGAYSGEYGASGAQWPDDNPIEGDDTMERLQNAPPLHDMMEFDEAGLASPEEVAALVDKMHGMPRSQQADLAVQMSQTLEQATHRLQQWGFTEDEALLEANAAASRRQPTNNPFEEVRERAGLGYPEPSDDLPVADEDDMPTDPFKISKDGHVRYAEAPLPQSMMTTAPEGVDTLRQEKVCEVCGSDMDDGQCEVCGYEVPPEGFDNPDLQKAQEVAEMGGEAGGAPGGPPATPPPGVMAPPEGGGGGGAGAPPMGAGGGMPTSSTRKSSQTPAVTNERTAGKIRSNEQPILPATKTVSDHPKTTQVVKEPTRLTQSNTTAMTQIPTKAQVAAEMVKRGTFGVKTAAEAEALLAEKGLDNFLADATPASDPAEHHQNIDQVGGEVAPPESGTQHVDVEKAITIESIPTKTWSDTKDQHAPVTPEVFEGGGPIGDALASTKTADGQSGVLGDPTNAEKQIDVNKPLQPEFTHGPNTQTFKSDPFHVGDPVTTEDSNQIGGPMGTPLSSTKAQIVAHTLSAIKTAEEMVALGLTPEDQKFELAAQLEQETPEQLATRRDMLAKQKTAGLGKTPRSFAQPKLAKLVNSSRSAGISHDIEDDNILDSGLFG